ncbi:MAG TPA: flagellar export chaperone FlgN [Acetivibrio sp.]|nr:flagellar export chaperone FlgN [Acetivibrio sp.]
MDITPEVYIERLIDISSKKDSCLNEILRLTMAQSEAIKEDGLEVLQKLIDDKQRKIEEINKADEDFNVYLTRLKQKLGISRLDEINNPGIKGVKELQEIISRIIKLVGKISEIENQNIERANNLLNDFGSNIKRINEGKRANNAYNNAYSLNAPSYYIDKKK